MKIKLLYRRNKITCFNTYIDIQKRQLLTLLFYLALVITL